MIIWIICLLFSNLVLTFPSRGACERSPMDYMLVMGPVEGRLEAELDWLRQQVDAKGGYEPGETKDYLERVEDKIAQLSRVKLENLPDNADDDDMGLAAFAAKSSITKLWALLDRLIGLASEKPTCSSWGVTDFMSTFNKTFGGQDSAETARLLMSDQKPEHDVKLFNYMKHYAKENYRKCLNKMDIANSRVIYDLNEQETELDTIFSMGKNERAKDGALLVFAEQLDLARGKFNARKASAQIDDYASEHKAQNSAKGTYLYLNSVCQKFRHRSANVFDVHNLARALLGPNGIPVKPDIKFLKLNEYSRICIQFQDPNLSDLVRKNIEANMHLVWFKKIMNFIKCGSC